MLGLSEAAQVSLITAVISAGTAIVVAFLGIGQRHRHKAAQAERDDLKAAVKTTNGRHDTLAEQLDTIERTVDEMADRLQHGDERFDKLEAVQKETLFQVSDLRANTRALTESVIEHHHAWDDPLEGGPSLLEWAEESAAQDRKKRKGGR